VLYAAIKEGSLKFWRPWARGDMRVNLDELYRWAGSRVDSEHATADSAA
jgi:hypothetical protein